MKQSAVEWLLEQLQVCNYISKKGYKNAKTWLIQEVLEYEQEQQDEFAIGFAEWIKLQPKYKKIKKSGLDNCYIEMSSKELLEIYKKEKGL